MTKEQLLAELAASRTAIRRDYGAVRRELDVQAKLENLVRRKPFAWLGGAAALGWWMAGPKRKTRVVTKYVATPGKPGRTAKKPDPARLGWLGVGLALFKFSLPFLKPLLTAYAGRQLTALATRLAK